MNYETAALTLFYFYLKEQELCLNVTLIIGKSASDPNYFCQTSYFDVNVGFNC